MEFVFYTLVITLAVIFSLPLIWISAKIYSAFIDFLYDLE